MVDSINNISGAQGLNGSKSGKDTAAPKKSDEASNSGFNISDEVSISKEAAELAEAAKNARAAREELENNPNATLSNNTDALERLSEA
ncbi:MAG: hypothetical protein ACK4VI_07705 [Alphaproteobacteria bacterium]